MASTSKFEFPSNQTGNSNYYTNQRRSPTPSMHTECSSYSADSATSASRTYASITSDDLVDTADRLFYQIMQASTSSNPPKTPSSAIPSSPPTTAFTVVTSTSASVLNETPLELTVDQLHENPQYVNVKSSFHHNYANLYEKCQNRRSSTYCCSTISTPTSNARKCVPVLYAVIAALVMVILTLLITNFLTNTTHPQRTTLNFTSTFTNSALSSKLPYFTTVPIRIITGQPERYRTSLRYSPTSPRTTFSSRTPTTTPTLIQTFPEMVTWPMSSLTEKPNCNDLQFQCSLGGVSRKPCLYAWERCDGVVDCSDGSDEMDCATTKCHGNFQCSSNSSQCISLTKVCNGLTDCQDGSDETERLCSNYTCKSYEFRCGDGHCIPQEWTCDGDADCSQHDDEVNCSPSCPISEHRCPEGYCIPSQWLCNGRADCADGSDEDDGYCGCNAERLESAWFAETTPFFERFTTKHAKFQCASGRCIDQIGRCDGKQDCPDGSDEWSCQRLTSSGTLSMYHKGLDTYVQLCQGDVNEREIWKRLKFSDHLIGRIELKNVNENVVLIANFTNGHVIFDQRPITECSSLLKLDCESDISECHSTTATRTKRMIDGQLSNNAAVVPIVGKDGTICTATRISKEHFLTSAVCIIKSSTAPTDWRISPLVQVRRFITHPHYKRGSLLTDYDVMIVHVQVYGVNSKPRVACLPTIAELKETAANLFGEVGTECTTVGYGYTQPGGFHRSTGQRQINQVVWSADMCNSAEHYHGIVTSQMICSSSPIPSQRPCTNDEGAPLLCDGRLRGVLTTTTCTTNERHPNVYARIDESTVRWIAWNVENL